MSEMRGLIEIPYEKHIKTIGNFDWFPSKHHQNHRFYNKPYGFDGKVVLN